VRLITHIECQNVVTTKKYVTDVLTTFWRPLCAIRVHTHVEMEFVCSKLFWYRLSRSKLEALFKTLRKDDLRGKTPALRLIPSFVRPFFNHKLSSTNQNAPFNGPLNLCARCIRIKGTFSHFPEHHFVVSFMVSVFTCSVFSIRCTSGWAREISDNGVSWQKRILTKLDIVTILDMCRMWIKLMSLSMKRFSVLLHQIRNLVNLKLCIKMFRCGHSRIKQVTEKTELSTNSVWVGNNLLRNSRHAEKGDFVIWILTKLLSSTFLWCYLLCCTRWI